MDTREPAFDAPVLALGLGAALFCLPGLCFSTFSIVLLADEAVGRIIRSKKLPSTGAKFFFSEVCELCDSRRCLPAKDVRGAGFVDEVCGLGLDAVEDFSVLVVDAAVGSCFARDEAVGAVRCDGRSIGFVASRGFGFDVGDVLLLDALSEAPPFLAIEAAVGAVREVLLAFFSGALLVDTFGESFEDGALPELGVFG